MMLEKSDINAIDTLLHYWKSSHGKLMVRFTGLHGLGGDNFKAGEVMIEYLGTLALYIIP